MTLSGSWTLLAAASLSALVLVAPPTPHADAGVMPLAAQAARQDQIRPLPRMTVAGRGAFIGAAIDDVMPSDAERLKIQGGAVVQDVTPDGPAAKAGLRRNDVIVEFDGERVRSARQLSRLVQESAPNRAVSAKILRDGRTVDMSLTPGVAERADLVPGDLRDRLGDLPYELDQLMPGALGPQLGVTVHELTPQLAAYFGAKDGLLVASVSEDSAAARAGLKAGDVIASVNGRPIATRADLTSAVRQAGPSAQLTLTIVRDKKESSVTAQLPDRRNRRSARSRRSI